MHISESLTTLRINDYRIKRNSQNTNLQKAFAIAAFFLISFSTSAQIKNTCPTEYLETSANTSYPIEEFFSDISTNGNNAYLVLDWPQSKPKNGVGIDLGSLKGKPWIQWQKEEWEALIAGLRILPKSHHYMQQDFIHRPYLNNYIANKISIVECYANAASINNHTQTSQQITSRNNPSPDSSTPQESQQQKTHSYSHNQLIVAHQERTGEEERARAENVAEGVAKSNDKIYLPDFGQKCLRTVDIKQDRTMHGVYWYALENICNQPVMAHWCDRKDCSKTNKAWEIPPGGKEKSWTDVIRNERHPRHLKGFACQLKYKNASVYKDPKANRCFTLKSLIK